MKEYSRILERLGEGDMDVVFMVQDTQFDRSVASTSTTTITTTISVAVPSMVHNSQERFTG